MNASVHERALDITPHTLSQEKLLEYLELMETSLKDSGLGSGYFGKLQEAINESEAMLQNPYFIQGTDVEKQAELERYKQQLLEEKLIQEARLEKVIIVFAKNIGVNWLALMSLYNEWQLNPKSFSKKSYELPAVDLDRLRVRESFLKDLIKKGTNRHGSSIDLYTLRRRTRENVAQFTL